MNQIPQYLCFVLLTLSIGCHTSTQNGTTPQKEYAFRAVIVDAPEALLQDLNIPWSLSPAFAASNSVGTLAATDNGDLMEKLLSSPRAHTTELPVVLINPGERVRIDKQRPIKYPTEYDAKGKPLAYETQGVGLLIDIDMKSETNGMASFSYHIEDVAEPVWQIYDLASSSAKIKLPLFHCRSVSSSSDTRLFRNTWLIMGGMMTKQENGTKRNTIFGLQMKETQNAQHDPAGDRLEAPPEE